MKDWGYKSSVLALAILIGVSFTFVSLPIIFHWMDVVKSFWGIVP